MMRFVVWKGDFGGIVEIRLGYQETVVVIYRRDNGDSGRVVLEVREEWIILKIQEMSDIGFGDCLDIVRDGKG